jgi:hypothetical protein
MLAVWLDLRGTGTRLYGARSSDAGATWSKNLLIYESPDGTICQCCHPSAIADGAGRMWVMWRNCVGGVRDMYITSSVDGADFTKPEKLGHGSWKMNACPMDGGGIGLHRGRVLTAWRREKEIYLAAPGEAERRIAEGTDVTISGHYAAWVSGGIVQVLRPGASQAETAGRGSFPNLLTLPDGKALAAWEDEGRIVVQIVRGS